MPAPHRAKGFNMATDVLLSGPSVVAAGAFVSAATKGPMITLTSFTATRGIIRIKNPIDNTDSVYVGNSTLTNAGVNGFLIEPGETQVFGYLGNMYCVAATGTPTVYYYAEIDTTV